LAPRGGRLTPAERESAWQAFLLSLYRRGLRGQKTASFIHDGSDGLEPAGEDGAPGGRGSVWPSRPTRSKEEEAQEPAGQLRPKADLIPEGSDDPRRDVCPPHPEETAQLPIAHFA